MKCGEALALAISALSLVVSIIAIKKAWKAHCEIRELSQDSIKEQKEGNRIAHDTLNEIKKSPAQKRAEWLASVGLYNSPKGRH